MNNPQNAAMQKPKLKRFYEHVAVSEAEGGWQVLLDGKAIRTPAKALLILPSPALAEAVAEEWDRQGEHVELDDMYHMQFSCAAVDYTGGYRADVEAEAANYITTDLLCYRAQEPDALVQKQNAGWNSWVDWAKKRHDLDLALVLGIMPVDQSPATLEAVMRSVRALDDFRLTALWLVAKHTGSLVLALAVVESALDASQAFTLSRLEEDYQAEQWGEDAEAQERRAVAAAEMAALGEFITLLQ